MLPRLLGPRAALLHLSADTDTAVADLSAGPEAAVSLDWSDRSGRPALHHSPGVTTGHLVEQIGSDPSGRIGAVAHALGAVHLVHPAGTIPLAARLHAELGRALEEALLTWGAPEALDEALTGAGFAVGPFALQDRLGIDTLLADRQAVETRLGLAPLPLFARAVSEGRLGRKASVGWHRYPGQGGAVADPLVEDMAEEEAHFAGWPRRPVPEVEAAAEIAGRIDRLAAQVAEEAGASWAQVAQVAELVLGYTPRPAIRPNTTAAKSPLPDR